MAAALTLLLMLPLSLWMNAPVAFATGEGCTAVPHQRLGDGATLSGDTCYWYDTTQDCQLRGYSNGLCWYGYADSSTSDTSYELHTAQDGEDRCGTNPYSADWLTYNTSYNATSDTTNVVTGPYKDCGSMGHDYRLYYT